MPTESQQKRRQMSKENAAYNAYESAFLKPDKSGRKGVNSKSGKRHSKFERGEFVVWDGEGADINGRHEYILLAYRNAKTGETDSIENSNGLSSQACLEFLLEIGRKYPRAIHVMFGASYDMNMMLKGILNEHTLKRVWKDQKDSDKMNRFFPIGGGYAVEYTPKKCLKIQKNRKRVNKKMTNDGSICLWDVIGFFQMSFVKALKSWKISPQLLERIQAGKARRSDFDPSELPYIKEYCGLELETFAELMERFHHSLVVANLPISRWDGAGAIAAAMMRQHEVKIHKGEQPDIIQTMAQKALFGGRIESIRFGHCTDSVYRYDLNSAYPSAMRNIPSFQSGVWLEVHHTHSEEIAEFALYDVEWQLECTERSAVYPLPFRDFDDRIYFPKRGIGTYWGPEVRAALQAVESGLYTGTFTVKSGMQYYPHNDTKPFAFIDPTFEQRRQWVREGNAAEKPLKLGLNSLYGKTAQQTGGSNEKKPPFFQLEWAGYITSSTRARLFTAACHDIGAVIAFATDAVFSLTPLPVQISDNKELGLWEETEFNGMTIVQSGVYWLDNTDGTETQHSRGFAIDGDSVLTRERVLHAWQNKEKELQVPSRRTFITMGPVAAGQRKFEDWCQWKDGDKKLDLQPRTKRRPIRYNEYGEPDKTLMYTRPAPTLEFVSQPFRLLWELDDDESREWNDGRHNAEE